MKRSIKMSKEEPTTDNNKSEDGKDKDKNPEDVEMKKDTANGEEIPDLKKEDPIRCRLRGGNLNLWLWSKKEAKLEQAGNKLLDLIRSAKEIQAVDVGADLWAHLSQEDVTKVLEAVAELPKLKWVRFALGYSSQSKGSTERRAISMKTLACIASKAKELRYLILKDVVLDGSVAEWKTFTSSFQSHDYMSHLRLENYAFTEDSNDLGDLVSALASVPSFETLEIFASEPFPSSSPKSQGCHLPIPALESLIRDSKSIQKLRLSGLDVGNDHLKKLTKPLSKSDQTLQELVLWRSRITEQGAETLASVLKVNTSLLKLNLHDNDGIGSRGCQALIEAVPESRLQELYMGCAHMDAVCRKALLDLVAGNTTSLKRRLKRLETCFSWPLDTTVQAVAEFGDNLEQSLKDPNQALQFLRFYHDQRQSSGGHTKELHWGSVWEQKRPLDDGDDDDEAETAVKASKDC